MKRKAKMNFRTKLLVTMIPVAILTMGIVVFLCQKWASDSIRSKSEQSMGLQVEKVVTELARIFHQN